MIESEVLIGTASTLLREKLSTQGKVLSCNFSGLKMFDFPIKKLCFLKNPSYQLFSKRLKKIIDMSESNYVKKINFRHKYLMNDSTYTNSILSNFIKKTVSES